jgi:hypothetical protein
VGKKLASGSDVWGFKATVVRNANLKVQIKVEVGGNLNGAIEHRSGS